MEAGSQGAIKSGSHSRWCLFVISCPETTPRVRPMLEWEQAFGIVASRKTMLQTISRCVRGDQAVCRHNI